MMKEGGNARFRTSNHRRGAFPAMNIGVLFGKGQLRPMRLNDGPHGDMVGRLLASTSVQRLASYASCRLNTYLKPAHCIDAFAAAFQLWSPKVYQHYAQYLSQMYGRLPDLKKIFPQSVFPCAAFNFGGNVWAYMHKDTQNCPYGMCAIQALGRFDPTKGGHLVLWELRLIIEFPPASLILVPSATITHSNIPVQAGDTRASFTQFCAGSIFRWVDYGFRTEAQFLKDDEKGFEHMASQKGERWEKGLLLLSTMDELVDVNA